MSRRVALRDEVLDELPKHLVVGTSAESRCSGQAVRRTASWSLGERRPPCT
jgi:hypothetical protein